MGRGGVTEVLKEEWEHRVKNIGMDLRSSVIVHVNFFHIFPLGKNSYSSRRFPDEDTVEIYLRIKKPAPIATVVEISAGFVESDFAEDEMSA